MRFCFKTRKLHNLYFDRKGAAVFPPEVVRAFFRVATIIQAVPDEAEFYRTEQLHYEKFQGKRGAQGHRSMRLHGRWRLIVCNETDDQGRQMLILEISNHYE